MAAEQAPYWTDIVAALSAVAGVGVIWFQLGQANRIAALGTVQEFVHRNGALWRECTVAAQEADAQVREERFAAAVTQVVAHFELFAVQLVEAPLTPKIHRLMAETLVDSLSIMAAAGYARAVTPGLTDRSVCRHLRDFCLQHRAEFRDASAVFAMMNLPRHAL